MGIVCKNANFRGSEIDFLLGKKLSMGNKFGGTKTKQKRGRSTGFSSAPNTCTHLEHVHAWLLPFSVTVIVNTAAGCYFRRQSLLLNAVTPTHFCTMFWQRKKRMFWQFWKIHHVCCSSCQLWRRSGDLQTPKLKSHLVRTQSLNILPFKPGVG